MDKEDKENSLSQTDAAMNPSSDADAAMKEKELEHIEGELLKEDREKRKEKMIVEGRSVFDIKKKKEER